MRIFLLMFCFFMVAGNAQNKQLLFGYNEIPQSTLINPSTKLKNKFFIGIPLLSHINLNLGFSGVSVYDLFADDGVNFNIKLREAIYKLDRKDFFSVNQQVELLNIGMAYGGGLDKTEYLTMGVYLETDAIAYFPKDIAVLAYEGNGGENIDRVFNIGDIKLSAETLTVFHLGTTKKINNKFTVGARGKIYSSLFNISSINNRGRFYTDNNVTNNFYNQVIDLDVTIRTSGLSNFYETETEGDESNSEVTVDNDDVLDAIKTIRKRILFGGNLGLGIDVGGTYTLLKDYRKEIFIEGSLQDLGFIHHHKTIENYVYKGVFEFEGVNPLFPSNLDEDTDYFQNIKDNVNTIFDSEPTTERYTTLRPLKLNAAIRYKFPNKDSKGEPCNCLNDAEQLYTEFGAQLFAVKRPRGLQMALTAYYYKHFYKGLSAKLTYTVDSYSLSNIGVGLSANFGAFNLYILTDNILNYNNISDTKSLALQFGMNLIFKNKK